MQEIEKKLGEYADAKIGIKDGKIFVSAELSTDLLINTIEAKITAQGVIGELEKGALEIIKAALKAI
jgi:hypothetical protein